MMSNDIVEILNSESLSLLHKEQPRLDVIHTFYEGHYIREAHIPKGTVVIGRYHVQPSINICIKGKILISDSFGCTQEVTAPFFSFYKEGSKVGYAIEDTVWLNIFNTDCTDVYELDKILFEDNFEFNMAHAEHKIRKSPYNEEDLLDYHNFLKANNLTEDKVRKLMDDFPVVKEYGSFKYKVGLSPLNGKGIFATAGIKTEEVIGYARIEGNKTTLGRYMNHSLMPNAFPIRVDNSIMVIAIYDIEGCFGGFDGEEITIDYNEVYLLSKELDGERLCLDLL